jgi:tight adherence protein B
MTAAAAAAAFLFLGLLCFVVALFSWSDGIRSPEGRLRDLQRAQQALGAPKGRLPLRRAVSSIPGLRERLTNSAWAKKTALDLARAGLNLRVGEYVLLRALLATLGFVVPWILSGAAVAGLIVGLVLAVVGIMAPALYVEMRKRRRRHAIERELAEGLAHIASAMRAGFALLQAIDSAARRLQPPLAQELAHLVTDVNLGRTLEEALADLNERIGSYDLDMVVTAILIQRRTGGNLSEVLDNVTETMRERDRVRGEIRVLTAQQRFAGIVLSVWPVALAAIFFLLNPDVMSNLWTTPVGLVLLISAAFLQLLGFLTIRRILAIDI